MAFVRHSSFVKSFNFFLLFTYLLKYAAKYKVLDLAEVCQ